ncbi:hypothetical protein Vi05172_g11618 [Venturia inaequalis]|nr:hypothetical protein Vi05172_g11618 [Venturia inaequalis]
MVFEPSATTPTTLKTMNATAIDERTDTMNGNRIKEPRPATATCYSCNMCRISYLNVREQRVHMKELWHVSNIKRRIDSLPPISRDEFDAPLATMGQSINSRTSLTTTKKKKKKRIIINERSSSDIIRNHANSDEDSGSSEDLDSQPSPFQCLFCKDCFDKEEDGLSQNLTHMRKAHNFRIPNADKVSDVESLTGYLATEICTWRECLYCGAMKDSKAAIQSHMRDRGHCVLNLEREPELCGFWESDGEEDEGEGKDDNRAVECDGTIRFPSGKIIASKTTGSTFQKSLRKRRDARGALIPTTKETRNNDPHSTNEEPESPHLTTAPPSSSRQLSRREEMSLTGISPQQRQLLILGEKTAQRTEAMARRAREWVNAKSANKQEFDQLDNRGKHGKQNHKLLPR